MQEGEDKNFNKNTIVNENNYVKYIHYLESNLIALPVLKIFKYRIMSCIKCLLYIDIKGDLSIIETGSINIKRSDRKYDYLLVRVCNTDAYSLFIKNTADDFKMNLNDWCVIRHKIFKKFYLVYPQIENDKKTLKYVAKEGKINLLFTFIVMIIAVIGFLSLFNII